MNEKPKILSVEEIVNWLKSSSCPITDQNIADSHEQLRADLEAANKDARYTWVYRSLANSHHNLTSELAKALKELDAQRTVIKAAKAISDATNQEQFGERIKQLDIELYVLKSAETDSNE